jgi:hypothetical protein
MALTVTLTALAAMSAAAQTKMSLRPESKLTLAGSSNIHDWSCNSSAFQATVEMNSTYETSPLTLVPEPINKVTVVIPVKSLKCGHGKMDDNMYKALNAETYPEIRFVLGSYTIDKTGTTADKFVANTVGQLTVSGKTIEAAIPITAERKAGGAMIGEGKVKLLMTSFGIKPPVALLGTLRTKDEIEISFKVLLDKSTVVALTQ